MKSSLELVIFRPKSGIFLKQKILMKNFIKFRDFVNTI